MEAHLHIRLKPGGTVVEGTAGNTGIGLAHVCRSKGYDCVIYMPNTQVRNNFHNRPRDEHGSPSDTSLCQQSQEKIDLLRMLGADVRPVPGENVFDVSFLGHFCFAQLLILCRQPSHSRTRITTITRLRGMPRRHPMLSGPINSTM